MSSAPTENNLNNSSRFVNTTSALGLLCLFVMVVVAFLIASFLVKVSWNMSLHEGLGVNKLELSHAFWLLILSSLLFKNSCGMAM